MTAFHFDPYSPAVDADPFPYYQRLRDEHPCFWSEEAQMWILSRYQDIVSAGQDWQTYSSASGNLMTELTPRRIDELCEDGTISGGMIPKIAGALDAAKSGVNAVHIIDGRVPHALLLEVLGDQPFGTMIRSH